MGVKSRTDRWVCLFFSISRSKFYRQFLRVFSTVIYFQSTHLQQHCQHYLYLFSMLLIPLLKFHVLCLSSSNFLVTSQAFWRFLAFQHSTCQHWPSIIHASKPMVEYVCPLFIDWTDEQENRRQRLAPKTEDGSLPACQRPKTEDQRQKTKDWRPKTEARK